MGATRAESRAVRVLCERIIVAQTDEIALMSRWLEDHGQPVPDPDAAHVTHVMAGGEHAMRMPGMLTDAQLAQLERARGAEFDRLFVTYMIGHHEGALTMVGELFDSNGGANDDFVFKMANDIYADQLAEIDRMHQLLDALEARVP